MGIAEAITSGKLIFGAEILVDLDVERILIIAAGSSAVKELLTVGQRASASRREILEHVQRGGIKARVGDDPARKRLSGGGRRGVGGRIEDLAIGAREVAIANISVGNSGYEALALALAEALIVHEKEGVVLDNGPADRAAKLVLHKVRQPLGCRVVEKVARVQRRIAQELKSVAVEAVRSGLQSDVHYAAASSDLRHEVAGFHHELLHGFERRQNGAQALIDLVIVNAVQNKGVIRLALSIDGKPLRGARVVR